MHENANREFRKIPSLKFLYEVNSNGTIFRNAKSKKQLKIKLDYHHSEKGYYTTFVHIGGRKPDNKIIRVTIHRVVAECWLGPCPKGYEVDHRDRNTHNNNYRNLRYVTKSEQMKNRDHTNISKTGSENLEKARQERAVHVVLTNQNQSLHFESLSACARWLTANYENAMFNTIRDKLRTRRRHIYDYDVQYLSE